ncbi:MAG TPA: MFS transporter [Ktedonobacterales bacterium]
MQPSAQPTTEASARPHRNKWIFLLVLFTLAGVVESQAFGHLGAFTPLFLQELAVPPAQVPQWTGILSALGFVIGLPLLPFWGVWADRYSRKLIIVRSAYVEGLLFTVAALSPNVWVLAASRLLSGFVLGNTGVMLALLADVTPRRRLGLAVGIASAGFPLGSAIGPYFGGLIAQGPGIRTLLLIDAGLSALMGVVLTLLVREEPRVVEVGASAMRLLRAAVRHVLASPRVVRLFILYFVAMFGLSLSTPFVPIVIQRLDAGPAVRVAGVIGATLTAAGIAMAVTTPLWGRLGDLVGRWRILPVCLIAICAGLAVEAAAPALGTLQGAIFGIGLFQGAVGTTIIALLALLAPEERRAPILNFALLPSQLSWFLAPIAGAGLVTLAGRVPQLSGLEVRVPIAAGAVAMVLAALLALRLARHGGAMDEGDTEAARPQQTPAQLSAEPVLTSGD